MAAGVSLVSGLLVTAAPAGVATAAAPAVAVIAQTYYHNWRAEIDGQATALLRANAAFQAVQVPAGDHRVHLFYEDGAFEVGAVISGCLWLNCLVLWLLWQRRDWALAARPSG